MKKPKIKLTTSSTPKTAQAAASTPKTAKASEPKATKPKAKKADEKKVEKEVAAPKELEISPAERHAKKEVCPVDAGYCGPGCVNGPLILITRL